MWKYAVYNYTERKPYVFRVSNNFSEDYLKAYEQFNQYYAPDVIVPYPSRYPALQPRSKRLCRFCNMASPAVQFRKKAHVLPQCMGNRFLIHDIECDDCNQKFSLYETSLADFIGMFRTTDLLRGQGGVPKFKSRDGGLIMYSERDENGDDVVTINSFSKENLRFDEAENRYILSAIKTTYTPLYVMKALFKVGYSLLTNEEIPHYKSLHRIITSAYYDTELKDYCALFYLTFPIPFSKPIVITYKKREQYEATTVPTKMVAIYFGRFMYQFILLNDKDTFMYNKGESGEVLYVPPYWDINNGIPTHGKADLSSNLPKKDDSHSVALKLNSNPESENPA